MSNSEAQLIGRFVVDSVIGAGGVGRVFKVRDPHTGQIIALKLTNVDEENESSSILPRFRREFNVARRLNHPHLIQVYEFGSMDKQLFYTMELIDGMDWSGHLRHFRSQLNELDPHDRRTLWSHILELLIQAADALAYLHENGLVHRDIKPGNLLIAKDHILKVTDFGTMRSAHSYTQMTKTGSILGTVAYMSPEQTVTSRVDHRSDMYSLGLIAFESFTGQSPFEGPIMKQILMRSRQDVPDPRRRVPELPGSIAEVINRMVRRRPEDRFSTARELNIQLQAARDILLQLQTTRLRTQAERPMLKLLDAPMIGCDSELHRIYGALQHLSTHTVPRILLIQGGIGMGKTRLIIESRTQAELMGREVIGRPNGAESFLQTVSSIWEQPEPPAAVTESVFSAFFDVLMRKPALVVFENMHRRNEEDRDAIYDFLKYVVHRCLSGVPLPVLIILTTGEHEPEARWSARTIRRLMRNYDEFYHHRLKSFTAVEIRQFISAILPGPQELFDLSDRLYAVTGGNPFHVEHCVRHLVTEGVITHVGAVWVAHLDPGLGYRPLTRAETPFELVRYASERLRLLEPDERRVVQVAALFPVRFTVQKIAALVEDDESVIAATCDSILQKGIFQNAPGMEEGFTFSTPVLASWAMETFSSHLLTMTPHSVTQLLELFPDDPPIAGRLAAAQMAQRMKRPDLAMEILMKYAEEWYAHGWICPSMTAWRTAMNIQTDTDGTLVLKCSLGIGRCMRDLGHWRSALAHFDELVHHSGRALKDTSTPNRKLTEIYILSVIELADTMRRLDMFQDAEKRMTEFMSITRQPDLKHLHRHTLAVRARIRRDLTDYPFADSIFQRILQQLDPVEDRGEANRYRLDYALTLLRSNQTAAALSILDTAVIDNIKPDNAMLTCRIKLITGDINQAMKNTSDALTCWNTAAAIAEKEMFPLERCAALIRIASITRNREKEEFLLRVQSILHRLDMEEMSLDRII
ncbi:protein kinase [bacterium]|nr:protein kinase [candidate division CSSED10-310 bacterium]